MMRRIFWIGLIVLSALCMPKPGGNSIVSAQRDPARKILELVNGLRTRNGLAPFIWDQRLAAAAQNQANYMAANNIYSHTGDGGSSPQSRARAAGFPGRATENIVGGTGLTPGQGVVWWQNSPIHLNTLLAPHYSHVGIAMAQGFDQNFYALVAGSPSGSSTVAQPVQGNDQQLAPVAPIILAAPGEDGSVVHTVGSGQSFWIIAARYEVPLEQLYLFNNLTESSVISPGDQLIIQLAEGQEPPPTATPPANHVVREGDSWWTIAAWHKLSVEELLWLNSASENSLLQPGDEVRIRLIPGESPPPTATPQLTHIVSAGETAWDIAIRYNLVLEQFLELNGLGQNPVIGVGDELIIVAPTATPTATVALEEIIASPVTQTQTPTATPTSTPQALSALESNATTVPGDGKQIAPINVAKPDRTALFTGFALLLAGVIAIIIVLRVIK